MHYMTVCRLLLAAFVSVFAALLHAAPDLVVYGGPVITLDGADRVAEALAVEDGVITAVGSRDMILASTDDDTQRIDLDGRALLPGFFDSHSHATGVGMQALSANLLSAPDGEGNSIADLQRLLGEYLASEPALLAGTGWLVGFGYDDSQLNDFQHAHAVDHTLSQEAFDWSGGSEQTQRRYDFSEFPQQEDVDDDGEPAVPFAEWQAAMRELG